MATEVLETCNGEGGGGEGGGGRGSGSGGENGFRGSWRLVVTRDGRGGGGRRAVGGREREVGGRGEDLGEVWGAGGMRQEEMG